MPVAENLVEVVRELLVAAASVQLEALAQPAESGRSVVLEQLLEARGDVYHGRLGERSERLEGGLHGEVRAARLVHGVEAHGVALAASEGVVGMEVQVGGPRLVRVEEHAGALAQARDVPHRIQHALVGAGREDEQARIRDRRQGALDVRQRDGPPHAETGVPAGRQVVRHGA